MGTMDEIPLPVKGNNENPESLGDDNMIEQSLEKYLHEMDRQNDEVNQIHRLLLSRSQFVMSITFIFMGILATNILNKSLYESMGLYEPPYSIEQVFFITNLFLLFVFLGNSVFRGIRLLLLRRFQIGFDVYPLYKSKTNYKRVLESFYREKEKTYHYNNPILIHIQNYYSIQVLDFGFGIAMAMALALTQIGEYQAQAFFILTSSFFIIRVYFLLFHTSRKEGIIIESTMRFKELNDEDRLKSNEYSQLTTIDRCSLWIIQWFNNRFSRN